MTTIFKYLKPQLCITKVKAVKRSVKSNFLILAYIELQKKIVHIKTEIVEVKMNAIYMYRSHEKCF